MFFYMDLRNHLITHVFRYESIEGPWEASKDLACLVEGVRYHIFGPSRRSQDIS